MSPIREGKPISGLLNSQRKVVVPILCSWSKRSLKRIDSNLFHFVVDLFFRVAALVSLSIEFGTPTALQVENSVGFDRFPDCRRRRK